ncbi:cation diffusion facilitator family transporter [Polycladomyces subterraneus]|uniref:Cation diffusion facilitator family transporter n=1 Tax=Polycladomyces subterraneus TaxID=1016997 RepID=A0ABT8INA4_9BACL|nr:cation diffusion facilitator family transporter [Polycladomyces subterraneus]MDN4594251.1 cation diffusion facilitator family transporter [Polycladomyces subterraneus]
MHHHHHGHHGPFEQRIRNKMGLTVTLVITAIIMIMEIAGGILSNSLALLSDAGHMFSDTASLALSLLAIWFATKPPSPRKTYGFYRLEILAALINGIALFIVAGMILREAYERFLNPPHVAGNTVLIVAFIGLIANLVSAAILIKTSDIKENLNVRSAYLHILGDALGSVGTIVAGLLITFFSWYMADPIISVIVVLLILKSAWGIIRDTTHVLMEGAPVTIDQDELKRMLMSIDKVINVHDLHIWTITSGMDSLSCHVVIEDDGDSQRVLQQAVRIIEERFQIRHTTIQVETSRMQHAELEV